MADFNPDHWKDTVKRLNDRFGQFILQINCANCVHYRRMEPLALGKLVGESALIEDVVKRLRCSKCGKVRATYTIERIPKVRGRGLGQLPKDQPDE